MSRRKDFDLIGIDENISSSAEKVGLLFQIIATRENGIDIFERRLKQGRPVANDKLGLD